jgi:hypothetical protein
MAKNTEIIYFYRTGSWGGIHKTSYDNIMAILKEGPP